jgi:hypothetical protein
VALDRPAALRRRLTTGRVVVRVQGDAAPYLPAAREVDPSATADGPLLALVAGQDGRETPALVRALVGAGAEILEVRPDVPALEDVYLHLMAEDTAAPGPS